MSIPYPAWNYKSDGGNLRKSKGSAGNGTFSRARRLRKQKDSTTREVPKHMKKTLFRRILAAMLVSLTLVGCASVPSDTPDTDNPAAEARDTDKPAANPASDTPVLLAANRDPQTVALDAAFLQGVNDFSTELFHKSLTSGKNLVLSPYSVYNLLAILANGASGDTAAALSDVLGYDDILTLTTVSTPRKKLLPPPGSRRSRTGSGSTAMSDLRCTTHTPPQCSDILTRSPRRFPSRTQNRSAKSTGGSRTRPTA